MAKETARRTRLRRGDEVIVVSGANRGQKGRILRVLLERERVVVEGVNLHYRHIRRSQQHPQGGRLRRETPIHISNVMLVDPEKGVPTRIGKAVRDAEKASRGRVRIAKKSGADLSAAAGKPAKKGRKAKE